jgi:hypothetical protein
MQFIDRAIRYGLTVFIALSAMAQGPTKPTITSVKVLPSELISSGTCTVSSAGYIEKEGRTNFNEAEIGSFISSYLREGYIVTVYPATKRGTFVSLECPSTKPTVPKQN